MYHSIHKHKKANIATSTSDRVDLKIESDARDKEKYFIDSIHQEKLMILKEYFDMKMRKMYECVVCGCIEMVFLFEIFFLTQCPFLFHIISFHTSCSSASILCLSNLWDLLSFLS